MHNLVGSTDSIRQEKAK